MNMIEWLKTYWVRILLTLAIVGVVVLIVALMILFPCDPSISDCYNCTGVI